MHTLVEQAPQLLPLSGSPRLAIVGREVRLGSGSADLVAVEPTGRLVVIEVKLATNGEARRAVVAQVLAYAANLHGMAPEELQSVLGRHLAARNLSGLAAAAGVDAAGSAGFQDGVEASLAEGRFRLVIVLDDAPPDLVKLIGYLETITGDRLVIDLVTVAAYQVGDTQLVVPTRVEPERQSLERTAVSGKPVDGSADMAGASVFADAVAGASSDVRDILRPLLSWAQNLEDRGLATLTSRSSPHWTVLRVYVPNDMSLVTLNCGSGNASMQLWASVFARRAPAALDALRAMGVSVGQGTALREVSDEALGVLDAAYHEAASGRLPTAPVG